MKRILLSLIFLLCLTGNAFAACGGSSPNFTTDGNELADVQECLSSAVDGDTITVAVGDGTATWSSALAVTRGVKIVKGAGSLTITAAQSGYLITYTPSSTTLSSGGTFQLSGFTFAMDGRQWVNLTNSTNTGANVIIDNNVLTGMSANPSFITNGLFYGVIYSNTFTGASSTSWVHFDIYGRDNANDWTYLTMTFGSANNLYFEDNIFTGGDTFFSNGHGGRSAVRYNTFNYTGATGPFPYIDIHGNQPGDVYAPLGVEVYNNYFSSVAGGSTKWLYQRGGKYLAFYNSLVTDQSSIVNEIWEEYDDEISDVPTNVIDGQPQHVSNSYYWNNRSGTAQVVEEFLHQPFQCDGYGACDVTFPRDCTIPCTIDNGIMANREWWNYTESFSGATGMGCGTLANRPATCTTGVGYWVPSDPTAASCADLTNHVGASASSPVSGTLYKCTSTNTWASYYTPYEYPHPLRGESGGGSYVVTISKSGDGTGTVSEGDGHIDCGTSCSYNYYQYDGQEVTFTATPATGMYFSGWTGGCVGAGLTCTVTISEDTTITASFTNGRKCSLGAGGGTITVGP